MTFSPDRALVALIRAGFPPFTAPAVIPVLSADEWRALVHHAQSENLTALCYRALKNTGHFAQLPADLAKELRLAYLKADVAHWQAVTTVSELLNQFDAAHIPVVLLKGVALSATLYRNGALRQVGDLDLLIHPEDKTRVVTLFQSHNLLPPVDLTDGFREGLGSEQTYMRRGKNALTIDLHWHVINVPSYVQQTLIAWFWARTMNVPYGQRVVTVLNWDAQLLHLIEHFVLHHQMRGTRWECDIALLLALHRDELRWAELLDAAREFRVLPALNATFMRLEQLWGVAVPDHVCAQLSAASGDWASRAAFIATTADRPDILLLREGLSYRRWRDKVKYLFHYFFPSPNYMRQRYHIASRLLVPFFYGWRLILGAARVLTSVVSILRHARKYPIS